MQNNGVRLRDKLLPKQLQVMSLPLLLPCGCDVDAHCESKMHNKAHE